MDAFQHIIDINQRKKKNLFSFVYLCYIINLITFSSDVGKAKQMYEGDMKRSMVRSFSKCQLKIFSKLTPFNKRS